MCTTYGERKSMGIRCQKKCLESKFDGQTDSHSDYSAYLRVVPSFYTKSLHLGDNRIQNFHLGRYIVGYTVRNLVLRRRASGAVKRDFRTYIRRYTSPNEILNMVIPILMHFCSFVSNRSVESRIKPQVIQRNVT